jgi:exodeoxyribonuclease-1
LPLAQIPERKKSIIVVDLMTDPGPLLELDADAITDRLFTPAADLPQGVERIPLKTIAINRCPMLAPAGVLRDTDTDRIGLDAERCRRHAALILPQLRALRSKLLDVYKPAPLLRGQDPDSMLYSGDFFTPHDRRLMEHVRRANPEQLATGNWPFQDSRLPEMLFRYRARNHPASLTAEELRRWEQQRLQRLREPTEAGQLGITAFRQELEEARLQLNGRAEAQALLDQVEAWANELNNVTPAHGHQD